MHLAGTEIVFKQGDITQEQVDGIVNAANSGLMGGGGVDGAIHRAGGPEILEACKVIRAQSGRLATGDAVITPGGKLPAKYVIHTVGPVWKGGESGEAKLLRACYRHSLELAREKQLESLAFPAISTGVYGYPPELAAKEALSEIRQELPSFPEIRKLIFVLFSEEALALYREVWEELEES